MKYTLNDFLAPVTLADVKKVIPEATNKRYWVGPLELMLFGLEFSTVRKLSEHGLLPLDLRQIKVQEIGYFPKNIHELVRYGKFKFDSLGNMTSATLPTYNFKFYYGANEISSKVFTTKPGERNQLLDCFRFNFVSAVFTYARSFQTRTLQTQKDMFITNTRATVGMEDSDTDGVWSATQFTPVTTKSIVGDMEYTYPKYTGISLAGNREKLKLSTGKVLFALANISFYDGASFTVSNADGHRDLFTRLEHSLLAPVASKFSKEHILENATYSYKELVSPDDENIISVAAVNGQGMTIKGWVEGMTTDCFNFRKKLDYEVFTYEEVHNLGAPNEESKFLVKIDMQLFSSAFSDAHLTAYKAKLSKATQLGAALSTMMVEGD